MALDPTSGDKATLWKRLIVAFGGTAPTDGSEYSLWQALISAVLASSGGTGLFPLVYNVLNYGTVADINAAINAAYAVAEAANGGILFVPAGAYTTTTTAAISNYNVSLMGAGSANTKITYTGGGDALRVKADPFNVTQASAVSGLTLDGTSAGAGSAGLHYGDIIGGLLDDLVVQNFTGTGSIGYHLDNVKAFTERLHTRRCWANNNTTGVLYDTHNRTDTGVGATSGSAVFTDTSAAAGDVGSYVLATTTGGLPVGAIVLSVVPGVSLTLDHTWQVASGTTTLVVGGSGSYAYHDTEWLINANAGQAGVHVTHGSILYGGSTKIRGNIGGASCTGILIDNGSGVESSTLNWNLEMDATGATMLNNAGVLAGTGAIDMAGGISTTTSTNIGSIEFAGWFNAPGIHTSTSALTVFGGLELAVGLTTPLGAGMWSPDTVTAIVNGGDASTGFVVLRPAGANSPDGQILFGTDGGVTFYDSTGTQRSSLYSTEAAPSSGLGVNGSWALGEDGHIYFKVAGAWTVKV